VPGRYAQIGWGAGLVTGYGAASFVFANAYIALTLFLGGIVLTLTVATITRRSGDDS
jgi:hypothetical protein